MEPGDETYFSVIATDNKPDVFQQTKSATLIFRWLDEEVAELALEGMQIRFVPEYFRSQRQIIIETEQLIADKKDLSAQRFTEISNDLGFSQKDLKDKYGQYLGDEQEESAMHGLADGYHGGESISAEVTAGMEEHEDHHEEEHDGKNNSSEEAVIGDNTELVNDHEHQHSDSTSTASANQTNNNPAQAMIDQFAHSHSTEEVGPLSNIDPKTWMKMAVNEMWQAEMYLLLSQPEKALPFEYSAYKYFRLARKAERIYVKRLGFEPPPVSEDKRLTGELSDILSYTIDYAPVAFDSEQQKTIKTAYHYLTGQADYDEFPEQLLRLLQMQLIEQSKQRESLFQYATILEKIIQNRSLTLDGCEQCVRSLANKLFQLIELKQSVPSTQRTKLDFSSASLNSTYDSENRLPSIGTKDTTTNQSGT
jgi:hypothetical protein